MGVGVGVWRGGGVLQKATETHQGVKITVYLWTRANYVEHVGVA